MPLQPACCVIAVCIDCGYQPWEDREKVPHFTSLADAKNSDTLADWEWVNDIPFRCGQCAVEVACATYGHDWTDWQHCQCHGEIARHHDTGCPDLRWCTRCSLPDYAYPATPADQRGQAA
jgi:hypothetical protein